MLKRPTLFGSLCNIVIAMLCAAVATFRAADTKAGSDLPPNRPEHGLIYDGLRARAASSPCGAAYEMPDGTCTHGPDPLLPGLSMNRRVLPIVETPSERARTNATPEACADDGVTGKRVQVLYVRGESTPNRFEAYVSSIRKWTERTDDLFNLSAQKTAGSVRVRFVRNGQCEIDVQPIVVADGATATFRGTTSALRKLGFDRIDRKYVLYVDDRVYCGIGQTKIDDRPGLLNLNNLGPMFARIDAPCWNPRIVAHELMHMLGGVQDSAPHSTFGIDGSIGGHCTDESDLMCYSDVSDTQPRMQLVCSADQELRFDCNNDDYFHTSPEPGSYLDTHFNAARNVFLIQNAEQLADGTREPLDIDDGTDGIDISAPGLRLLFPMALNDIPTGR